MMKLNHDEPPNIVSVDVRSLIQADPRLIQTDSRLIHTEDKPLNDSDTLEFPISQENVVLELDQNERLQGNLQSQGGRGELGELKWNTDHVFHGPQNPVLNLKQEYLMEDNQQPNDFDPNRISEHLTGGNHRHGEHIQLGEQRITEVSDEKPITTSGVEKIKRPKFSCKDCSFIGINKYDIIRHRRPGYRELKLI